MGIHNLLDSRKAPANWINGLAFAMYWSGFVRGSSRCDHFLSNPLPGKRLLSRSAGERAKPTVLTRTRKASIQGPFSCTTQPVCGDPPVLSWGSMRARSPLIGIWGTKPQPRTNSAGPGFPATSRTRDLGPFSERATVWILRIVPFRKIISAASAGLVSGPGFPDSSPPPFTLKPHDLRCDR
jgi:hypothetical protein